MTSAKVVILEYICPALGMVLANIMFSSPLGDLHKAVKNGELGDLNPTPWAFMLGNCFGWVTYAILRQNLWVFFGNSQGFLISIWLNLGAVKLMYQRHHVDHMTKSFVNLLVHQERSMSLRFSSLNSLPNNSSSVAIEELREEDIDNDNEAGNDGGEEPNEYNKPKSTAEWMKMVIDVTSQKTVAPTSHENLVMVISMIWAVCIAIICLIPSISQRNKEIIVASLVNLNLVFFYGAPLSTIYTVLRERNTSTIHVPTMITNTLNGLFWTAYGAAVFDLFIAIPNGLGAFFGIIQFCLCIIFPRQKRDEEELVVDIHNTEENGGNVSFPLNIRDSNVSSCHEEVESKVTAPHLEGESFVSESL